MSKTLSVTVKVGVSDDITKADIEQLEYNIADALEKERADSMLSYSFEGMETSVDWIGEINIIAD